MNKGKAIVYALMAATFYAVNIPLSKILLQDVEPVMMAAFLYLGAGAGIFLMSLCNKERSEKLSRPDLPFVIGMIVLDIAAPILLMFGIAYGTSANASLLGNFEIVATTIIALCIFKEAVSKRLWAAIMLITLSSVLLSFEGMESFKFSYGSVLVLFATLCWGMENNCTRKISSKSAYEIVVLKGVFSGVGAFIIAFVKGESVPELTYMAAALSLGFVSYGLSIFLYVRSQNILGAAKTSAYYAIAPFIGAFLSAVILEENLSQLYFIGLIIMIVGSLLVVADTLIQHHTHFHRHSFKHTHDGISHTHTVTHSHEHNHLWSDDDHNHSHKQTELEFLADKVTS